MSTTKNPERDDQCVSVSCRGNGISHDLVWAVAAIFTLCVILMQGEY
jgi:hypothetical protein